LAELLDLLVHRLVDAVADRGAQVGALDEEGGDEGGCEQPHVPPEDAPAGGSETAAVLPGRDDPQATSPTVPSGGVGGLRGPGGVRRARRVWRGRRRGARRRRAGIALADGRRRPVVERRVGG